MVFGLFLFMNFVRISYEIYRIFWLKYTYEKKTPVIIGLAYPVEDCCGNKKEEVVSPEICRLEESPKRSKRRSNRNKKKSSTLVFENNISQMEMVKSPEPEPSKPINSPHGVGTKLRGSLPYGINVHEILPSEQSN